MDKEKLREYRNISKEIGILQDELARLKSQLLTAPQPDGMPHSNYKTDRFADMMAKIIDLDIYLYQRLNRLYDCQKEVEEAIEALPSLERSLMRLRYIEGKRWEEIAVELGYSWNRVHHYHKRALNKF